MKKLLQVLKYVLVVGIITYVIRENGGVKMLKMMSTANWGWIGVSFLCFFLSIVLGAVQWKSLLRIQGVYISLWSSLSIYYLGMFFNALVINMAGDAMRVYKLKKANIDVTASFVATFMDRYLGFCILALFSVVAGVTIWYQGILEETSSRWILWTSLGVFGVLCTGTMILLSKRLSRFVLFFLEYFHGLGLGWIYKIYDQVSTCMGLYRKSLKQLNVLVFVSSTIHLLRIMGHLTCAYALHLDVSPFYFFCFIPIISLFALVPLNIGGWGVAQGVSVSLYSLPGVISGLESDSAISVAAGSLTFLPSILFYIVMLLGGTFISVIPKVVQKEESSELSNKTNHP